MENNNHVTKKNISGKFLKAGLRAAYWVISKHEGKQEKLGDKDLNDQEVISKYAQIEEDRVVMFKHKKNKKNIENIKNKEGRYV